MLGDSRCQEADERRCGRCARAALATCSSTRVCLIISAVTLARVHGQKLPGVAGACWREDFVYRAWFTIGRMAPSRASFVLLRDELLEREAFDTLLEAKVLFVRWRQHTNTIRPHSALGYRPPAPPGVAAPCVRMAYASANARGWSIGGKNPNLENSVIHGGRSSSVAANHSPTLQTHSFWLGYPAGYPARQNPPCVNAANPAALQERYSSRRGGLHQTTAMPGE